MKKKIAAIVIGLLFTTVEMNAQEKVNSLNVAFSPFGYNKMGITLESEDYQYNYKSYWNISLGYERQLKGFISLTELSYSEAAFDKYELKGTSKWFEPDQQEKLTTASLMCYCGKALLPQQRLQIPLYLGVGFDYLNGGPAHNITLNLGVKARVKFYITDTIAIFVGGNARYGLGSKHASEENSSSTSSYTLKNLNCSADAGFVIGI